MSHDALRSSQVVTTFGPGSMVDLPDASVIVAGLDHWSYDRNHVPVIEEPRLVSKLQVLLDIPALTLRAPPPASDQHGGLHPHIVGWRFPKWFSVQWTENGPRGRRRRLIHEDALDGDRFRYSDGKMKAVVPVRFVRACTRGHIDDIDWKAFVHQAKTDCPRDLWLEERGTTGELDDVYVVCDCGKDRTISQAARRSLEALGHCNGKRPWLGPGSMEGCGELSRLLIRSASNAYFAQTMSVISIPDARGPVDDAVRALWDDHLSDVESLADLLRIRRKPTPAVRLQGLEDEQVMAAIARRHAGGDSDDRQVKDMEFEALADAASGIGADVPEGDFFARALPRAVWEGPWMVAIRRVVLVHRLREVVAQVGFTRFEAAGPDINGELALDVKRAPLALDAPWLPAIENRGEGVFLELDPAGVADWLARSAVQARGRQLLAGFELWRKDHEASSRNFPGLPYVMLHSLSHLLLSAISLECGYPASSLRERVYAADGRYGILLFTGSSDSEGTLGGLVQAAREISRHMHRALSMGGLCSNDPICAFHVPTEHDSQHLHGSACHGCLLVSETSCEQHNEFLDRALAIPTIEDLGCAMFGAVGL